jgi:uncharacterized protein YoxC
MVDQTLHVILTAVEIVALVAVLAIFLILLISQLRSLAAGLQRVSEIVQGLERRVGELRTAAGDVNAGLGELAEELPRVADKAETLTGRRR